MQIHGVKTHPNKIVEISTTIQILYGYECGHNLIRVDHTALDHHQNKYWAVATSSHEFISCQCWVQIGSYNYDTPPHNRRQLWQCDNRLDLLWVHKGPTRFLHLPCPVVIICAASFSPIINAHFALKSYAQPEARGNMQKLMHIGEHQTF